MRNPGLALATGGVLSMGLWLVPACGGQRSGSSQDATVGADVGADVATADRAPTPSQDLALPEPDLAQVPDFPPSDPTPAPDILNPRDLPEERTHVDLADALLRDVPSSDYPAPDEAPRADFPADRAPLTDLPPNLDQAPAYDLANIPDEPPQPDVYVSPDTQGLAELCTSTGGALDTQTCCTSVSDFRDMCTTAVGACGCSAASSHTVSICTCPQPGCFLPAYGCVGPSSTCTVGMNQTCNDNPVLSSIHGRCVENGRCVCLGFPMSISSGKCE
jgi:hypothetical protein